MIFESVNIDIGNNQEMFPKSLSESLVPFEFRTYVIVNHKGQKLGFLKNFHSDINGKPKYFTIDSTTEPDDNYYPTEFIESIEGSRIQLCRDFDEIRGLKFYSLESLAARDPYLYIEPIAS
ncbi:MAG: hypothetical protein HRU19_01415 [Pseudobacteriovorax sp.]|nr:hypothetical protein [Pseudobacteriovorax sp.]